MELLWKAVGGLLIAAVLGIALGKDMSVLLSMAVCAMGAVVCLHYLEPILSLLKQIEEVACMQGETLGILLKILGIGILTEIAGMVCSDAGSGAMSKLLKILSCAGILWVSIPVFQSVLSLLQQILGEI